MERDMLRQGTDYAQRQGLPQVADPEKEWQRLQPPFSFKGWLRRQRPESAGEVLADIGLDILFDLLEAIF